MSYYLLLFFAFIIYLLLSYINKNKKFSTCDPPGPSSIPILGALHLLGDKPHHGFKSLAEKFGGIYKLWMGDTYTIVVSDPKLIREVWINNHDNFLNRHHSPTYALYSSNYTNIVSGENERWTYNRGLVSPTFTKLKIKSVHNIVQTQMEGLMEQMKYYSKSQQLFNPRIYLKKYSMNIITKLAFGFDTPFESETPEWLELSRKIDHLFDNCGTGNLGDYIHALRPFYFFKIFFVGNVMEGLRAHIKTIYHNHVKNLDEKNPKDLFDEILINTKGTDNEYGLISIGIDLLIAGTDTSSVTLEWFFLRMLQNPNVQEKIYQELEGVVGKGGRVDVTHRNSTPYTVAVIKEVLRMNPIAPLALNRCAKESVTVGGYHIPKGTQMILNVYSVHLNEKFYPNVNEFRPERWLGETTPDAWLPFGIGPRNCVGLNLAQDELYVAVANTIMNFKLRPSTPGAKIDFTENFGLTIKPNEYSFYLDSR